MIVLDRDDPSRSVRAVLDDELGFYVLKATAGERREPPTTTEPYVPAPPLAPANTRDVTLIPFYFRANRAEDTRWTVFLPYE
jgi:hypothetical protein